jgi:hypothetical protein
MLETNTNTMVANVDNVVESTINIANFQIFTTVVNIDKVILMLTM